MKPTEEQLKNIQINARSSATTDALLVQLVHRAVLVALSTEYCGKHTTKLLSRENFLALCADSYDELADAIDGAAETIEQKTLAALAQQDG
jgi:hypothetical protein